MISKGVPQNREGIKFSDVEEKPKPVETKDQKTVTVELINGRMKPFQSWKRKMPRDK